MNQVAKQDQNVVAVKPKDQVRHMLKLMAPEFSAVLPAHLPAEKLVRVCMNAISATPKLLNCDKTSLIKAVMASASLGLEPNGPLGHAYLIPFGNQVQFIVGYKGLLALARNSGEVQSISAHCVHEHDQFDFAFGLDERCEHVPALGERGAITHVYAVARFKDGGHYFDVMGVDQVEEIRNNSQGFRYADKGKKDSPWHKHFEEMARKTAIRRIAKYLPMSVQKAAEIENSYERGNSAYVDKFGDVIVEEVTNENQIEAPAPTDAEARLEALEEEAEAEPQTETDESEQPAEADTQGDLIDEETGEVTEPEPNRAEQYQEFMDTLLNCHSKTAIDSLMKDSKGLIDSLSDNLRESLKSAVTDARAAL